MVELQQTAESPKLGRLQLADLRREGCLGASGTAAVVENSP